VAAHDACGAGATLPAPHKDLRMHILLRLIRDEQGQDLLEYAMLSVFVALASKLAFMLLGTQIHNLFIAKDAADQSIWEPPQP
jgi:Flp pilus assembly pilin Flp